MWVGLGDKDRDRLGCPEWMELDLDDVTVRDYRAVQRTTGLRPVAVVDAYNDGAADGYAAFVWFACRAAGVDVGPFDTFDFALSKARFRTRHPDHPEPVQVADVDEGKGDPTPEQQPGDVTT